MRGRTDDRDRPHGLIAVWVLPPLLTVAVAVAAVPAVLRHPLPAAPPLKQRWMATRPTVNSLGSIDPDVAALFFDRQGSYVLGGAGDGTPAVAWSDERKFERDLRDGAIPPNVKDVMYDPEGWPATPRGERRHPIAAMRAFATAARAAGYRVIITPHPNLVDVSGASCARSGTETTSAAFLRCGIEGAAARLADVVEVQGQWLEGDPTAYRSFVEGAADQARRAHPGVVVLAGLSTRFATDPGTLLTAWDAVSDLVDGHYLAVPEGIRPEVAAGFLRMLAEQRG
jgi:hypothetical protein